MTLTRTFFLLVFLGTSFAWAQSGDQESTARHIEGLLMAPCCWGSTVAEHSSEEALAIKREIRTMLTQGKTEPEILASFEAQYGERILSRPKATGFNLLVWVLPGLGLLIFGIGVVFVLRRWRKTPALETSTAPSTADQAYRDQIDRELYGTSSTSDGR